MSKIIQHFTKEQVATLMTFAWNEGFKWSAMQPQDAPIHSGSLHYLRGKSGATISALDSFGQKKARQLMEVL